MKTKCPAFHWSLARQRASCFKRLKATELLAKCTHLPVANRCQHHDDGNSLALDPDAASDSFRLSNMLSAHSTRRRRYRTISSSTQATFSPTRLAINKKLARPSSAHWDFQRRTSFSLGPAGTHLCTTGARCRVARNTALRSSPTRRHRQGCSTRRPSVRSIPRSDRTSFRGHLSKRSILRSGSCRTSASEFWFSELQFAARCRIEPSMAYLVGCNLFRIRRSSRRTFSIRSRDVSGTRSGVSPTVPVRIQSVCEARHDAATQCAASGRTCSRILTHAGDSEHENQSRRRRDALVELGVFIPCVDLFQKKRKGEYSLTLTKGSYFDNRFRLDPGVFESALLEPLRTIGFDEAAAARLISHHSPHLLREWIDITLAAKERGIIRKSPQAYFTDNVREAMAGRRTPPDWWHEVRKAELNAADKSAAKWLVNAAGATAESDSAETSSKTYAEIRDRFFGELLAGGVPRNDAVRTANRMAEEHCFRATQKPASGLTRAGSLLPFPIR